MAASEKQNIEEQRKEAKKLADIKRVEEISDIKELMKTAWGRRIAWRVLSVSRVFHTSFNTNSMQMAFNEGHRNQGIQFLAEIQEHCPESYILMTKENKVGNTRSDN